MWIKCKPCVIGVIVGFIVAFIVSNFILSHNPSTTISEGNKTVVVRLVTKIDTLKIPQNIYHTDTVKTTLIKSDTVFKDNSKEVVFIPAIKRVYSDSTKVSDSIYVGYKAHVTGTLDKLNLTYSNRKSIVVIHKQDSVISNTTITKHAGGLYIGVDGGYNTITPKLEYVRDKNIFSAGYNIINKSPQIGYSRKIF